jgi:hypothetical protein
MARGPLRVSRNGRIPSIKRPGPGTLDFALRSVRGGRRMVMEELAPRAMEFEPRLEIAVRKWQQLTPWQRRFVTLDSLAAEAGLLPEEFFGAISRASFELTSEITDLVVACSFPGVVAASAKRARTSNGISDRQLLFEHMASIRGANREQPSRASEIGADATPLDQLAFLKNE